MSHEQSETIQDPKTGEWYNVYGKALPKAGQQLPDSQRYKTRQEAEAAAIARSWLYGQNLDKMLREGSQGPQAPAAAGFPVGQPQAPAPQGRYYGEMPADAERGMLLTQREGEGGMANMMGGAFAPDNRFVGQQQGQYMPTIARWRANRRADERMYGTPQFDPLSQQADQAPPDPAFMDRVMEFLRKMNEPVSPIGPTDSMSVRG